MKVKIIITHIPTGKIWESDPHEMASSDVVNELCKKIAEGKATYARLDVGGVDTYFPPEILAMSTISRIEVKE